MADLIGPFDSAAWSQTEWYQFAPVWAASGIIGAPAASIGVGDFAVTASGRTLTVACNGDRAWIDGSGYKPDSDKTVTVTANTNASLSRRDRLVIRRDLAAQTTAVVRLPGTAAGTPAAPALTQTTGGVWETPICSFLVPPASGTTLSGFVDERVWIDPGGRDADIPVRTATERDALTKFIGLSVKRLDDLGRVERWTGAAWAGESDVPVLASITARNTYFSGNLRAGASALVAGNLHVYDGSAWRFRLSGEVNGVVTDTSAQYVFAHGGGQAPTAWGGSPTSQATDQLNTIISFLAAAKSSTNLTARFARSDTNAYLVSQPVSFTWWAKF